MNYWQVNTVHNVSWAVGGDVGIERLQETRSFHIKAKSVQDAIAEVLKYGGGTVIQIDSITSVQSC
jgi:hypothetical protein